MCCDIPEGCRFLGLNGWTTISMAVIYGLQVNPKCFGLVTSPKMTGCLENSELGKILNILLTILHPDQSKQERWVKDDV